MKTLYKWNCEYIQSRIVELSSNGSIVTIRRVKKGNKWQGFTITFN